MGFVKKAFKKVVSVGKKIVNVAKKVWKNPLFQVALNVGMMMIPGGAVLKGASMLGKLAQGSKLLGTVAGFASKFMGPMQSLLQSGPMKLLSGFLGKAGNTGDLLSMATSLFQSRQSQPALPQGMGDLREMAMANLQQMFAHQQAQFLQNLFQPAQPQQAQY